MKHKNYKLLPYKYVTAAIIQPSKRRKNCEKFGFACIIYLLVTECKYLNLLGIFLPTFAILIF